jgi:hypothetical protein
MQEYSWRTMLLLIIKLLQLKKRLLHGDRDEISEMGQKELRLQLAYRVSVNNIHKRMF